MKDMRKAVEGEKAGQVLVSSSRQVVGKSSRVGRNGRQVLSRSSSTSSSLILRLRPGLGLGLGLAGDRKRRWDYAGGQVQEDGKMGRPGRRMGGQQT